MSFESWVENQYGAARFKEHPFSVDIKLAWESGYECGRHDLTGLIDGKNITIQTPALPESEVIKFLQKHIEDLNMEIHRYRLRSIRGYSK